MAYIPVPNPTLQRLPAYLQLLKRLQREGIQTVSCNTIAQELNLNPVLVRKDLAAVSSIGGRPKIGYMLDNLIVDVEHYLGYAETCKAVLAGTGHLGSALFAYPGFTAYGVEVVAAFDQDPALIGTNVNGKPILDIAQLSDWCREHDIKLGIITVPAPSAQAVCRCDGGRRRARHLEFCAHAPACPLWHPDSKRGHGHPARPALQTPEKTVTPA